MRTTITLDDEVFRAAKIEAATSGRTLSAVVQDALCRTIPQHPRREPYRVFVSPESGGGLREGFSLDDIGGILAYLDEVEWEEKHRR